MTDKKIALDIDHLLLLTKTSDPSSPSFNVIKLQDFFFQMTIRPPKLGISKGRFHPALGRTERQHLDSQNHHDRIVMAGSTSQCRFKALHRPHFPTALHSVSTNVFSLSFGSLSTRHPAPSSRRRSNKSKTKLRGNGKLRQAFEHVLTLLPTFWIDIRTGCDIHVIVQYVILSILWPLWS